MKGGAIKFDSTNAPVTFGTASAEVQNFLNNGTNGVLYPALGIELFAAFIGLRVEVGDLIYFNHGTNNNLRVTFGPQFRF